MKRNVIAASPQLAVTLLYTDDRLDGRECHVDEYRTLLIGWWVSKYGASPIFADSRHSEVFDAPRLVLVRSPDDKWADLTGFLDLPIADLSLDEIKAAFLQAAHHYLGAAAASREARRERMRSRLQAQAAEETE
jgi:hypothetical protein